MILENLEASGQSARKAYQRRLPSNPSKDYYFMNRDTGNTQSLIVEYGFLDNAKDAPKLKNNWQSYTDAVVEAILEYIGVVSGGDSYTVKSGDSLWSIAKKFGISVEELRIANNLTSNLLRIGQTLKIPKQEVEIIPSEDNTIYIVKSGDTLYSIANKYNISVNELINYNNLSSTNLKVGQQLLIPKVEENNNSNSYTVKSGDTLYSIANKFNTSVNEIMALNNLKTSLLNLGQVLQIPVSSSSNATDTSSDYIEYAVKSGDNLYSIANKYGTTVNELKLLNNLPNNNLNIGKILKIPSNNNVTYVVKSGDNLYTIASRFNTDVNSIKRKNNLSTNNLSVGQILII